MTARSFPVPLGVSEADLIREQRAAELRIVHEHDQHFATGFPRSEAFTDLEYIQSYRSECYHLALVWAFRFFRDIDPETDFAAARALALMAVREEFHRELREGERSLVWSVARDAMIAKATMAKSRAQGETIDLMETLVRRLRAEQPQESGTDPYTDPFAFPGPTGGIAQSRKPETER